MELPTRSALPAARGEISDELFEALRRPRHPLRRVPMTTLDPDDAHLALYACYELHYRGFADVDDAWEWEPTLVALSHELEEWFEQSLHERAGAPVVGPEHAERPTSQALQELVADDDGPSLSRHMVEHGTLEQMREFAVHRSAYQLKEADPHTWAIPRLGGRGKAGLVAIQMDEYGNGSEPAMHSTLFADTLEALELDATYGAHLHRLPASTLATVNLISLFGLHRRWRGAILGHLAVFEMTSVEPMGRYSAALRRFGVPERGRRFYDVHVAADAEHEQIALHEMIDGFTTDEPALAGQVLFGARSILQVEGDFAQHLLDSWAAGRSSLRG